MITFEASDFVPMDQWPLGWRFADGRGRRVGESLARIHPLTSGRASEIAHVALARSAQATTNSQTFRSDDAPPIVRARLGTLPPTLDTPILLSWSPTIAVVTDWEMFLSCWGDFCYPASDDVTVWPFDDSWTLSYRHYEIF